YTPKNAIRLTQKFFMRCITSIAWRTSKTSQYGSSQNIDFFFHMGAIPFSFGTGWLPDPFPKTTSRSFTMLKTSFTTTVHQFCSVVRLAFEMLALLSYRMPDGKKPTMTHVYNLLTVSQPYIIGII